MTECAHGSRWTGPDGRCHHARCHWRLPVHVTPPLPAGERLLASCLRCEIHYPAGSAPPACPCCGDVLSPYMPFV